ncbi:hypothetical protein HDV57DRAFT_469228 [Trichoderma longibrachiatum]|uniref:Uncharacterized protein n=1 Tax=Trichoderma longibrachiatum ATCC 18648 TaxID=983965 RepID=A0A2T4C5X4_TRILO|nr:hypothetical protein M440DRAFT_307067 [Trichoderma longibrachiatum ATCC 18648]
MIVRHRISVSQSVLYWPAASASLPFGHGETLSRVCYPLLPQSRQSPDRDTGRFRDLPGRGLDGFRHRTTATFLLHRRPSETVDPDTTSPPHQLCRHSLHMSLLPSLLLDTLSRASLSVVCQWTPSLAITIHPIPRIVVAHGQPTMRRMSPRTRSARQMRLRHITFPHHDSLRHSRLPTSMLKGASSSARATTATCHPPVGGTPFRG